LIHQRERLSGFIRSDRDSKETPGLCQTVCGAFLCSYPATENARQTLDAEVDYRVCASASPRRLRTMRRTLTKAGLTSTGRQSSRLRRRRRNIPSSLRLSQEKCGAQRLTRISLVFYESAKERTQEFVLRWSPDGGRSFREIVRQQWNFSRPDTIREVEEYRVELSDVTVLELVIMPDISGGAARASLKSLRLS